MRTQFKKVLVLGGTGLARSCADALGGQGVSVVSSLAGVTRHPHLPNGEIRVGPFGGVLGLAKYLQAEMFDCVIDATHPFAARMAQNAAEATASTNFPLFRLCGEPWRPQPGDHWTDVADMARACEAVPKGARVAVTVGRKEIGCFLMRSDIVGVLRMIEPPLQQMPPGWSLVLARPPFAMEQELAFLDGNLASILVCKNAGGPRPEKLDAARQLGIAVIMVERPLKPPAQTFSTVESLLGFMGLGG